MEVRALLIHPSYQSVCGRCGTEELGVTPGGLGGFLSGDRMGDPLGASEVGIDARRVVGQPNSPRRAVKGV
jgi:hypothetical protein